MSLASLLFIIAVTNAAPMKRFTSCMGSSSTSSGDNNMAHEEVAAKAVNLAIMCSTDSLPPSASVIHANGVDSASDSLAQKSLISLRRYADLYSSSAHNLMMPFSNSKSENEAGSSDSIAVNHQHGHPHHHPSSPPFSSQSYSSSGYGNAQVGTIVNPPYTSPPPPSASSRSPSLSSRITTSLSSPSSSIVVGNPSSGKVSSGTRPLDFELEMQAQLLHEFEEAQRNRTLEKSKQGKLERMPRLSIESMERIVRLEEEIHSRFRVVNVRGDNNCYFRSVARLLSQYEFNPENHHLVRETLVDHILSVLNSPDHVLYAKYREFFKNYLVESENELVDRLFSIGTLEGWGGLEISPLMSNAFMVDINIFDLNTGRQELVLVDQALVDLYSLGLQETRIPINLMFRGAHYQALIHSGGGASAENKDTSFGSIHSDSTLYPSISIVDLDHDLKGLPDAVFRDGMEWDGKKGRWTSLVNGQREYLDRSTEKWVPEVKKK